MRKQGYTYILLDLDGTITDSKEWLLESYRAGLAAVHFSDYTEEQLLSFLGPPLRQSLKYSFGFDEATLDAALQGFRERLAVAGIEKNTLYPGVREFLQWAHDQGKKLIVATSKTSRIARGALERCGILGDFDMVAGKDEAGGAGEKAAVIAYVLEHFPGIQKEECVMIGDRKYDILGAREMGMDTIAVLYGYGSREELESCCPDALCESLRDVKKLL